MIQVVQDYSYSFFDKCQGTGVRVPILTEPKDCYTTCLRQLVSRTTTYTHNLYN
jgi:hypothetical protein